MGGIRHKDVGDALSKNEWLAADSHKILDNVDMDSHYIIKHKISRCCHMSLSAGVTDIVIETIPAGVLDQDFHVFKIAAAVDTAPGTDKTVAVSVTNGTSTMTVSITDAATTGSTTENAFDVDVSAESFSLKYSQTAGGASTRATVVIMYYLKTNA